MCIKLLPSVRRARCALLRLILGMQRMICCRWGGNRLTVGVSDLRHGLVTLSTSTLASDKHPMKNLTKLLTKEAEEYDINGTVDV